MSFFINKITLFLTVLFFAGLVLGQKTQNDNYAELYANGDYQALISSLKNTEDIKELYYLALSYEKIKALDKAKQTLEKCVAKSYEIYARDFLEWQKKNLPKGDKTLSDFFRQIQPGNEVGLLAAQKAVGLDSDIFKGKDLAFKAEALRKMILMTQSTEVIYSNNGKTILPVKILEKTRAAYPKDLSGSPVSRRNQSPNKPITIPLLMVFGADGEIKSIIPVEQIIDAFTIEAWRAAAKIKFNPATINNKAVFSYSIIEYSFSIG
jgi:hypothetical protein